MKIKRIKQLKVNSCFFNVEWDKDNLSKRREIRNRIVLEFEDEIVNFYKTEINELKQKINNLENKIDK